MPTLFVVVPTFGMRQPYDLAAQRAVIAELDSASLGEWTGSGGTEGFLTFRYRAEDESAAREALARAMGRHAPGRPYHVRVAEALGCGGGFQIMREFLPKRYALAAQGGPLWGNFEQAQAVIRRHFPDVQFGWTASGAERVRLLQGLGQPILPELRERLEGIASELEGVAEGEGYRVTFGLGRREPVERLLVTPLGDSADLRDGWSALEREAQSQFLLTEGDGLPERES